MREDALRTVREQLEEPLLLTDDVNIEYLTGFHSDNGALLIEADRLRLFTDFRYAESARAVDGVEYAETPRFIYDGLAQQLEGRIGFEPDALTFSRYDVLRGGGLELVPRGGLVEALRAVKEDGELAAIRRAAEITSEAYERLAGQPFVGRTERDLAWRMEQLFRDLGGEEVSFPVTVSTGPNGAKPHAVSGGRVVAEGELVVVDSGAMVDGYCSDCTRTFAAGEVDAQLTEAYEVCREAQQGALEAVKARASGRDVDAIARERIDATDFRGLFGHGLGHGVGMRIHETPGLRPESDDVLATGNVVTIEPGIYIPGVGGVRIEDLVIVTDDGCEVLTTYTKELVTVG
jgi:Xaa-Pro aminopeptidase